MDCGNPNKSEDYTNTNGERIQVESIVNSQAVAVGPGATAIYKGLSVNEVAALVSELRRLDQPIVWNGHNPYLGLSSYEEHDGEYFFGREGLVNQLLETVQHENFVTIVGPSGCGKSSLVRAGLFRAMRLGKVPGSSSWLLVDMVPGRNPISQLAAAMEKATKADAIGDALQPDESLTPDVLWRQTRKYLPGNRSKCVLLIDQFEELFTQTNDPNLRDSFISLLTGVGNKASGRFIILISIRSEFLNECARYETLREMIGRQFHLVGAMSDRDLLKAIVLPALEVGATIESDLASTIIRDMKGSPAALPLMSFVLQDLFSADSNGKGSQKVLKVTDYVRRGGLESALERHANRVIAELNNEQQATAINIFLKLIEFERGSVPTRRSASFAELITSDGDAESITDVLDHLSAQDSRLLTVDQTNSEEPFSTGHGALEEITITITHERLLEAWTWLKKLVEESRHIISLANTIEDDAIGWIKNGRHNSYLYLDIRLDQALAAKRNPLVRLSANSQSFLEAASQLRDDLKERERLRRAAELKTAQKIARRNFQLASIAIFISIVLMAVFILVPSYRKYMAKYGSFSELVEVQMPDGSIVLWESFEVTNERYWHCVHAGECSRPSGFRSVESNWEDQKYLPVTGVNLQSAIDFCRYVDRTLPTASQWLYVAQPLQDWGDMVEKGIANVELSSEPSLLPVDWVQTGQSCSETGMPIYDLVGNASEWTRTIVVGESQLCLDSTLDEIENLNPVVVVLGEGFDASLASLNYLNVGASNFPGSLPWNNRGFRCVVSEEMVNQPEMECPTFRRSSHLNLCSVGP